MGNFDQLDKIIEVFCDPSFIVTSVLIPFLFALIKLIVKLVIECITNRTIVPKYIDGFQNRYLILWVFIFWKTTVVPVGLACGLLFARGILQRQELSEDFIVALGIFIFALCCVYMLLRRLGKQKLQAMCTICTILVMTVISGVAYLVLYSKFDLNENGKWLSILFIWFQISYLELYINKENDIFNFLRYIFWISEYILSMVCVVWCVALEENWIQEVLILFSALVAFGNAWFRIDEREEKIVKRIVLDESKHGIKEYSTNGAIKKTGSGAVYFKDLHGCKITVSENNIKRMTFDFSSKLCLTRKLEEFCVLDDPELTLAGNWYLKAIMRDWIWISSCDGKGTKNVIYPRNKVIWAAKKERSI